MGVVVVATPSGALLVLEIVLELIKAGDDLPSIWCTYRKSSSFE